MGMMLGPGDPLWQYALEGHNCNVDSTWLIAGMDALGFSCMTQLQRRQQCYPSLMARVVVQPVTYSLCLLSFSAVLSCGYLVDTAYPCDGGWFD